MRLLDRIDALLQKDFVNPSTWYGAACYAILFILAVIVLAAILPRIMRDMLVAGQCGLHDRMAVTFLTEPGQIGVYILVLLAYLHLIPGLRGVGTAMLTSVSVMSLVVGFAAQNALSNVIAGIALVLYRPFQIGGWIQVNAPVGMETGIVDTLALGFTAIRTADNRRIVIPNSQMASQTTINLTQAVQKSLVSIPVEIASGLDLDEIRAKLLSAAAQHSTVKEVLDCPVNAVQAGQVKLTPRAWCDLSAASSLRHEPMEQAERLIGSAGRAQTLAQEGNRVERR